MTAGTKGCATPSPVPASAPPDGGASAVTKVRLHWVGVLAAVGWVRACHVSPVPTACLPGVFGKSCAERCACPPGAPCDHITGQCSCPPGFTGAACETRGYPQHRGSFHGHWNGQRGVSTLLRQGTGVGLQCQGVLQKHSALLHAACPPGTFGERCAQRCRCAGPNQDCHPITGACICAPGHHGPDCELGEPIAPCWWMPCSHLAGHHAIIALLCRVPYGLVWPWL